MARQPINIGSLEFRFQKDALTFFKDILNSNRNNTTIENEGHDHLLALIERHPEADKKIGVGIKRFYKAPTDMGTSCFWLERTDGSCTDFSYISAVRAKSKSLFQEFSEACRNSIREDLKKTKAEFFNNYGDKDGKVECEITGVKIATYESHLDHKKPMTFQVLVTTFLTASDITLGKEIFSEPQDAQFETEFLDEKTKEQFKEYHHNLAQLRVIAIKQNLSLGGSNRITKSKRPVTIVRS